METLFEAEWRSVPPERMRSSCGICTKRAISQIEADKRVLSADELAQFSRIYNVDVRELLFVEFTEAGDEQRLTAKYSSFLKLLEKLSDREVEDVYWVIKRKVEGLL